MGSAKVQVPRDDLEDALWMMERKLKEHGLSHWRLTLVVRNPDPDAQGEWMVLTRDDEKAIGRLLTENG